MKTKVDTVLDTSGLHCPEPVMLLHKRVRDMQPGHIVEVIATDPSTTRDIPKFCRFLEHSLLSQSEHNGEYRFTIQKR